MLFCTDLVNMLKIMLALKGQGLELDMLDGLAANCEHPKGEGHNCS